MRWLWLALVLSLSISKTFAVGFGFISAAVGVISSIASYLDLEFCRDSDIKFDAAGLERNLSSMLYGQHLVATTLLKSVKAHLKDPNPPKPLVLSFHGLTGVGKNFVTAMLVDNLYRKKEKSRFVHRFNSELHFKHTRQIDLYKDQLQEWIYHNVSKCGRSLFIFDEMDYMPEKLVDVLAPFLEYKSHFDGVDFRKCIFIFLCNNGATEVAHMTLDTWKSGKERESMQLHDTQKVLMMSAYNEKGGLKKSKLVRKSLIDHFVPFLPLERSHVRKCVLYELKRQNVSWAEDDIDTVLDQLSWYPEGLNLFATSGCKKIAQKVGLLD